MMGKLQIVKLVKERTKKFHYVKGSQIVSPIMPNPPIWLRTLKFK